jgi:hypothetical protein
VDSIGTIRVQVAALESAASIIANASIEADLAAGQIRSAGGSAGEEILKHPNRPPIVR